MKFGSPPFAAPLRWSAPIGGWPRSAANSAPRIGASDFVPLDDSRVYWDSWPLLNRDGSMFRDADGTEIWFALSAPLADDPGERHQHALIYLVARHGDRFVSIGPAMPLGHSPGSREWSGSAFVEADGVRVTLLFTAAGHRGDDGGGYEQRLFEATATRDGFHLVDWSRPREILVADGIDYRVADQVRGEPGKIKAFRDPEHFLDPATGTAWVVFTGSSAREPGAHDGVIGLAQRGADGTFRLHLPLVVASGFNNELERPHVRLFDGLYYLFWTTQAAVFADPATAGPTGLYGAVLDPAAVGWELLNVNGLVVANPVDAPGQAYSWVVLPDRTIASFVDHWSGPDGQQRFGGTFAPFERLVVDGATVRLDADFRVPIESAAAGSLSPAP